jgi:hypothetical protein
MRNSGIRDIENVLGIHRDSVMAVIKAEADKIPVEPLPTKKQKVATAELDEFWSFAPAQRRTSDGHGVPGMYAKNASWHIKMVAVPMLRARNCAMNCLLAVISDTTIPMTGSRIARCYHLRDSYQQKRYTTH